MAAAAAPVAEMMGEDGLRAAPRRAGRPSASEARQKHEAMLEAALEEFARHGFHGASVRAIAERAGLSTRTLYNRYADKVALFAASLEQSALHDTWVPSARHSGLRDELVRFARHMLGRLSQDRQVRLARVIYRECTSFPQLEPIARRQYERFELEPTEQILMRYGVAPEKARDLAAFYVAMTFNRWQACVIYNEPLMSPAELNRHVAAATDLFLNGVLAEAKG
jgi:AcrR family transcriptional regulator